MPNIKPFDAGDVKFTPSEAGSAAFREAGGVATHFANQSGEMYRQAGRAIGGAIGEIGSVVEKAQQHTDAMAEIDFQSQLTQAEIAAQGGVNTAGTPTDGDGKPITDNPGRGVDKSLPPNANVPNPGQYATNASDTIEDHRDFLTDLLGRITGTGVSQKAVDRMRLQAIASDRRLALHANAIAGEVAFNHVSHTTEQTINSSLGALGRGDQSLDSTIDHINGAFDSFQGTLSGEFAAKGTKYINDKRDAAVTQAIKTSMNYDLAQGHPENAARTLNDPKWDKYIGGDRADLQKEITNFQKAQLTQQTTQRTLDQQRQKDQALARTDQYVQDAASDTPKMKMQDIWTDPAYANRPDLKKEAVGVFQTMRRAQTGDLNVSPQVSSATTLDIMKRMTAPDGDPTKITDRRAIDQAFVDQKLGKQDYNFLLTRLKGVEQPFDKMRANLEHAVKEQYEKSLDADSLMSGDSGMKFYRWQNALDAKIKEYERTGKPTSGLLTPGSPDFFGTPEVINSFKQSLQGAVNQRATAPGGIVDDTAKFGAGNKFGTLNQVNGLIIHHTSGGGDVNGVISTLKERGLGTQYVIDRQGTIHQIMPDNAEGRHIRTGEGKGAGLSNANTVGVEVIAKNDKDVLPVQVEAGKRLAAQLGQKYGFDPTKATFGHGEVNPGHKEADEGATITNAIRGGATQQVASSGPTRITNAAEYAALKPGTAYIDPKGIQRIKGGQ